MIIGITGGTGCGKTTFLTCIESLGGIVLDCDAIYHRLLRTDENMLRAIETRFPSTVTETGLDRKKLGAIVFADSAALQDLNAITHAAVKSVVLEQLQMHKGKLIAIDAIGLFEGDLAYLCDVTVAITAPEEDRIRRIMARDGIAREYAQNRVNAQHPNEWFAQRCDYVLENSSTADHFRTQCLAFLHTLGIM